MDDGKTITIALDPETIEALEASVAAGRYTSVEDAATHAIDEWWADRLQEEIGVERLRTMLQEAADSPTVDGHAVFARLRARYEAMMQAKGE